MSAASPTHGVLVVDKPSGLTSHDVVARVRRALGTRSVGHAGTLDPMATGVLVVAVGEATKLAAYLTEEAKEYVATVMLGSLTDSLDADGRVVAEAPVPPELGPREVEAAFVAFRGTLRQRAPEVSAIKQDGERLYRRARRGEVVEAPVREVEVHALELLAVEGPRIELRVRCSKGFYVRALARDVAQALGTVGHLSALRRTRSGNFGLEHAVSFAEVEAATRGEAGARERLTRVALPVDEAGECLPGAELTAEGVGDARHGRPLGAGSFARGELPSVPADAVIALRAPGGALVALGRREGERLRVVRGFRHTAAC
jgi:tRNA pseudouridine55 synthase